MERVKQLCQRECARLNTSEPLMDVQVLAPMKKGMLGVENLNRVLQAALNPAAGDKPEHTFGETLFRQGDKIMQIKNDYKIAWYRQDESGLMQEGTGVFNGDLGTFCRSPIGNMARLSCSLVRPAKK